VHIYDLSGRVGSALGHAYKPVGGLYHTSIEFNGKEYYYSRGIIRATAFNTPFGEPIQTIDIGHVPQTEQQLHKYLRDIQNDFLAEQYNPLTHNCNTFTDHMLNALDKPPLPPDIRGNTQQIIRDFPGIQDIFPIDPPFRPIDADRPYLDLDIQADFRVHEQLVPGPLEAALIGFSSALGEHMLTSALRAGLPVKPRQPFVYPKTNWQGVTSMLICLSLFCSVSLARI